MIDISGFSALKRIFYYRKGRKSGQVKSEKIGGSGGYNNIS
jgi:hypothetical protein